jgi:tetratricopeptide (TPR) repeat protein
MVRFNCGAHLAPKLQSRTSFSTAHRAFLGVVGAGSRLKRRHDHHSGSLQYRRWTGRQKHHQTCHFGLTPEQLRELTRAVEINADALKATNALLVERIEIVSTKLGVTREAAKALLRIAGEQDVPDERLAEILTKIANDYKRLQQQAAALTAENPAGRALVREARQELDAGRFERAREVLQEVVQTQLAAANEARKLANQANAAADAQMLGAANAIASQADVAMISGDYLQAVRTFAKAADLVPSSNTFMRSEFLRRQAGALNRHGRENRDNASLVGAINLYRELLSTALPERNPDEWITLHKYVGNALLLLSERESGPDHLNQAAEAYRAALHTWVDKRVAIFYAPFNWAELHNRLGLALNRLAERESGTAHLEEAVASHRAA